MAAKRKTVQRGRKPGAGNVWAFDIVMANPTTKTVKVKGTDALTFDGKGKRYTGTGTFELLGSDKVFAPPSSLFEASDTGAGQVQTRIGAQVREGIKRANLERKRQGKPEVAYGWESWDIGDDLKAEGATVLVMVRK